MRDVPVDRLFGSSRLRPALILARLGGGDRAGTFITLIDQAVVSLVNFLTTVVVGKICGADELGVYVLAFTAITLIGVACDALVVSPYMAQHRQLPDESRSRYSGSIVVHQAIAAAVTSSVLVAAALLALEVLHNSRMAQVATVVAIVIPVVLAREFARRFSMAQLNPGDALLVDAIAATLQVAGLSALAVLGHLSAVTALYAMAAANLFAVGSWWLRVRPDLVFERSAIREDFARGSEQGFWTFAALGSFLLLYYAPLWVLAFIADAEIVGLFAACQTLVMVSNPLVIGLANSLMPNAARAYAESAKAGVRSLTRRSTLLLVISMSLVSAPLIVFGGAILVLLYGDAFGGHSVAVALLALAAAVRATGMSPYIGLWAMGRSELNSLVNLAGLLVMMTTLPLFFIPYGLGGVAGAVLAGDMAAALVRWLLFERASRPNRQTKDG